MSSSLASTAVEMGDLSNLDPQVSNSNHSPMTTPSATNTTRDREPKPKPESEASPGAEEEVDPEYPSGIKLISIFIGLLLSILCVGLDRSIIATAVPKITTEFNSLDDVGWYGSSYLLTACCFQLMMGKMYAEFSVKWLFLGTLGIFEIGSIVCAAAPNSTALIIGRAIAGLGTAGLATGALLEEFLPIKSHGDGASGSTFLLEVKEKKTRSTTWRQLLDKLDILGTIFLLPATICLLLALQWGGSTYAWSSWRCILLLCIAGVCGVIWGIVQVHEGERATVPLRLIKMRSIVGAMWLVFMIFAALFIATYYISIWFQAVKNDSAYQAGINFLTATVAMSLTSVLAGFLTSAIGYYVPQMLAGSAITAVASGLIVRFDLNTSTGYWMGSLILLGLGIGTCGQQSMMVPQTILTGADISLGTSLMIFAQTISGTIFLSVCQNVFQEKLLHELESRVPAADPAVVIAHGASGLKSAMGDIYPKDVVDGILRAYSDAMQNIWIISVVLACLSILGVMLVEWKSVKKDKKSSNGSLEEDGSARANAPADVV
ncbi:Major facilitator superfamily transporter [Pleurostoma richardsiae]|uniref:Major facilitator superfamily transporter n=1 Tax=Pleurostoma richardsiae TaxID=41990 RepID=A0AA38RJA9_9PEZI|nr:Major facilitator superfamily transporter [Pleurostoma richardsiae]